MSKPDRPQALTLPQALIPVVCLVLLIGLSFYLFGEAAASGPTQVALVIASMITVFLAWRRGHSLSSLNAAATQSVSSGIGAIFILFAVGALIGTWALSGTLVAMIYYGTQLLSPTYFYMTTALVCAVVSFCIGSSWTVVGTIGIGLMGVAQGIDMDPAITAGAVISGAYFGDTVSPLSDSVNLAAGAAGVDLYEHIRETAVISSMSLAVALFVFWTLGQPAEFNASAKLSALDSAFDISPAQFLPLGVVVVLALVRLPPFTSIFVGAIAACLVAVVFAPQRVIAFAETGQDLSPWLALIKGTWLALASGYVSTTGVEDIDKLLSRGGMESMLDTIWLVMAALAFGGVAEKAGVLDRLVRPIIAMAKSTGSLVASMVVAIFVTAATTADQYIAIVLPARMFKASFAARGLAPVMLSRTVGCAATPTSALIPWNSCGAYMAATLGVTTFSYVPYAVFNMVSPLLVAGVAFAGIRTVRGSQTSRPPEERLGNSDAAPHS